MPAFYEITHLPERRRETFCNPPAVFYRLDDGSEIEVHAQPVWCLHCAAVTAGEEIGSVEQIDMWIAGLERLAAEIRMEMTRPPPPAPDAPGDRHQREEIAELKRRHAWRLGRRSPPRCVECGSPAIVPLEPHRPLQKPGGDGAIVIQVVGLYSPSEIQPRFLSPEGVPVSST